MTDEYVVVTTVSQFRMRYVMHKDDLQSMNPKMPVNPIEWAKDTVTCEECEDFSQEHLGEVIVDTAAMSEDEMLELFDKDNEYLSTWSRDYKIDWTRRLSSKNKDNEIDMYSHGMTTPGNVEHDI